MNNNILFSDKEEFYSWEMTANQAMSKALALPDVKPLYKDLWYTGEIAFLFAETNVGKSIYAMQVAEYVARSGIKTMYLDYELSYSQFKSRYTNENGNPYVFSNNLLRPDLSVDKYCDSEMIKERFFRLLKFQAQKGVKVFIVDNITYLCERLECGKFALAFMKELKQMQQEYELSILVVAHTPKRNVTKPLQADDLAGSKKLLNFADSSFALGKALDGTDTIYLKQIKTREGRKLYGEDNVIMYIIEKNGSFLRFTHIGYKEESKLLQQNRRDNSHLIPLAYKMHLEGKSGRSIAKEFNVSEACIRKWLTKYRHSQLYLDNITTMA